MNTSRRKLLLASGLLASGSYINYRGLRFPRMGFEHALRDPSYKSPTLSIKPREAILLQASSAEEDYRFRAIAPEPTIHVNSTVNRKITLSINNIAGNAVLRIDGDPQTTVFEKVIGISRELSISFVGNSSNSLSWSLPEQEGLEFAVIGDTGAGLELEWVLTRAAQLNAQFLLHLGDFNYGEGEYERAIELFYTSAIPCYISIGNHDYNDSGLIYQSFIDQLGPMNSTFEFAGTRFVNIDSAASFFPPGSGHRGRLIDQLRSSPDAVADNVFFTHKPFEDPRPGRGHDIGGWKEKDWLLWQMRDLGANTILTGHVHRSAELDFQGIKQYTAGEGLGYQDIVSKKQVSQILMGRVESGQAVNYSWENIDMPWSAHTSPAHTKKLELEQPKELLDWYREQVF